jgi:hypothetical protein
MKIWSLALGAVVAFALAVPALADPPGRASVQWIGDGAVAGAWSQLVRNDNGVAVTMHTSGLTPGDAVTMWWVITNPGDTGFSTVQYAAGHVIGGDGTADYGSYLKVGDTGGCQPASTGLPCGSGLTDPHNAIVRLVVRDHGPAIPGFIPEQIHSFGGGCGLPTAHCMNVQISVHPANQ